MPAASAIHAELQRAATVAAAKALASILPSRPMSMMPERSEKSPARAPRISGVATRKVALRVSTTMATASSTSGVPKDRRAARARREKPFEPGPAELRQRAGKQDHQPLDHD